MRQINITAKELHLIINALEIVNPDSSETELDAYELALRLGELEANERYTIEAAQ